MEKAKMLVVDDDAATVLLISSMLAESKLYDVVVALDGVNALKMAETTLPDLILMDWDLPGIDGIKAIEYLKMNASTRKVPVIMITGNIDPKVLEEAFEAGVAYFIRKPIIQIELLAVVKSILKNRAINVQQIDSKKKELSLASLQNVRYEQFRQKYLNGINQIIESCACIHSECYQKLEKLASDIKGEVPTSVWNNVEQVWKNIDPDFMRNLNERHPNLTPSEIKLCAYLKLNLCTKEIATLTFQNANSIRIARTRLRKKLSLSSSENLVGYICSM